MEKCELSYTIGSIYGNKINLSEKKSVNTKNNKRNFYHEFYQNSRRNRRKKKKVSIW